MPRSPQNSDPSLDSRLAEALALHQQGRVSEAQARYAQLLKQAPGNLQARYFQGLLRLQTGALEAGIADIEQVVERQPAQAEAHYNLGLAYQRQGRLQPACSRFERVLALQPDSVEARFYLGMALAGLGRYEAALPCFEHVIALAPGLAAAHLNLGNTLAEMGRQSEAVPAFEQAIALQPDFAEAYNGLAAALFKLNRPEEAVRMFRLAIQSKPGLVEAYTGLADVLRALGQYRAAADCCREAIRISPDDAVAHVLLGYALSRLHDHRAALTALERTLVLQPACVAAHEQLGAALHLWGRHDEARTHGEQAIAGDPTNAGLRSGQLFFLHYDPSIAATELALRHRAFAERFELPLQSSWQPHPNKPDPDRSLRIGFVSADLREHPVGYFMADLLAGLQAKHLELYAYANHKVDDSLSMRIKPYFARWHTARQLSDEELAAQIRADGIDILVDLSGHSENNRLLTFARKPAPVQVTYLGYFNTTGLSSMDYILCNDWLLPREEEALYTEKPWRLPDAHLCFTPPEIQLEVDDLPAHQGGRVTFGCFNKIEKVNREVVASWSAVLNAVPDSRLHLKSAALDDPAVAREYREQFERQGIASERLVLEGQSGFSDYLQSFNRIDISLDPFPYNGGTVTVQSLWMGVPVLTLHGDRYVAHMGESILHTLGMPEWIAADKDDYVAKAVALASDLSALAAVRAGLRSRLLASPICDAPRFARNLEAAFRGMWRQWCRNPSA